MKKIIYFLSFLMLAVSCDYGVDPDITDENDSEKTIKIEKLTGQVQKGPYNNGTTVSVIELNNELGQTGRMFKSEITNNRGEFEISNISLVSPYVIVEANGFYFNECTGENSEAQLTLSAIANITDQSTLNINLLSHLEKDRVMKLVAEGDTFMNAKRQAQNEILAVYEMGETSDTITSEHLDITKEGETNARLLAISAIMQIGNSTSDLSKLIADLKADLYDNGKLDDDSIGNILLTQATLIRKDEIRQNLETKCNKENMEASVPGFESYVDGFIENSAYKVNSLVSFPDSTYYGKNILAKDVDTVYYGDNYALAANLDPEISCRIVVKGKSFTPHIGLNNPTNCIMSGTYGNRIFESLPDVDFMNTEVNFESWVADDFGVSYCTIEYYEGTDDLILTDTKELVVVQRNYKAFYKIPEAGIYGENIWAMDADTLKFQPGTKYCFEFEMKKNYETQSLIRFRNIDTSKIEISAEDLLNYTVEWSENEVTLVAGSTTPQTYALSVVFKDHGHAEFSGHFSIFNGAEKVRLTEMSYQPIMW
ncbi:hypothetical protein ACE1ET_04835 [Saccharicrinis sp. FJH62]|uniref:hypothetical protein n=1 Tax=Saccharicrinis sp. FJH62 TaxID=3344657 RepID=UPI0035D41E4D